MGEYFDMQEDGILDQNGEYVEYEYGNCFTQAPKETKVHKKYYCGLIHADGSKCQKRLCTLQGLNGHRKDVHGKGETKC